MLGRRFGFGGCKNKGFLVDFAASEAEDDYDDEDDAMVTMMMMMMMWMRTMAERCVSRALVVVD